MHFKANIQKLRQLAKNFYEITQTPVTIYDEEQQIICSYPETLQGFCAHVRESKTLADACRKCDMMAFEACKKTRMTYIYHCHMDLVEVATPIVCNNLIIGYMLFGQIAPDRDKQDLEARAKAVAQQYGLDAERLCAQIPRIKYRTKEYIDAIIELLEMCANHIWLNSIISVHNEGLAYSIDYYIQQNLHQDLQLNTLCSVFSISRSTLYNISRKNFGCGITEYVTICRLNAAKKQLAKPDIRISEVAESVGYPDANYFTRSFKKYTGLTPKQYKETLHSCEDRPECLFRKA